MTTTAGSFKSKMQRPRVKSPGWAAFDRHQRQKQGIEPEILGEPFPPAPSANSQGSVSKHPAQLRSFSSVIRSSINYRSCGKSSEGSTIEDSRKKQGDQTVVETNATSPLETLKNAHSWANEGLIQDILAAVNNDESHASAILRAMSSSNSEDNRSELPGPSIILKANICADKSEDSNNRRLELSKDSEFIPGELILKHPFFVPIEPEWEEDDIYLIHRKVALKMMREASQHSKAASNAFLRGDHGSARQHSLKAQEVWMAAERLNAKAAKEILSIRNNGNDMWKLDLHGLHASEAVDALKEHLHKIESMLVIDDSPSDEIAKEGSCVPSSEYAGAYAREALARKQQAFPRQRLVLHVITGTGNHSRGQAALPIAVRSFLIDNGYRIDDARPGVVAVRPKFRHR